MYINNEETYAFVFPRPGTSATFFDSTDANLCHRSVRVCLLEHKQTFFSSAVSYKKDCFYKDYKLLTFSLYRKYIDQFLFFGKWLKEDSLVDPIYIVDR